MSLTKPQEKLIRRRIYNQSELASKLNLSPCQVSRILTGKRFTPHVQEAIAREAGLTVEGLFGKWAYTRRKRFKRAENGNRKNA